jgi:hypothetical protein
VTIYEADIDIGRGEVRVEVAGVDPPDADPEAVALAVEAIRAGAAKVLSPRELGAIIRVRRLVVHPVDFKSRRFELHTAEAIQRLLADAAEPGAPADGDHDAGS